MAMRWLIIGGFPDVWMALKRGEADDPTGNQLRDAEVVVRWGMSRGTLAARQDVSLHLEIILSLELGFRGS